MTIPKSQRCILESESNIKNTQGLDDDQIICKTGCPFTVPGHVINGFSETTECIRTEPSSEPARINCSPNGQYVKERMAMLDSNSGL